MKRRTLHEVDAGRFCWTCGSTKASREFDESPLGADRKDAECRSCAAGRKRAAELDGRPATRDYTIAGDNAKRAPRNAGFYDSLDNALRARPTSGLQSLDQAA
ncbi:hypothetical protein [Cellulomonas sp. SG140]|uniref:hypothetical protein n=1 Tax=Cellulomonas sp. SG140 TaxID=2976536 RepID=UPI0021E9A9EA|nr:hypothetical protein [Cellulomonas sp. SG140]